MNSAVTSCRRFDPTLRKECTRASHGRSVGDRPSAKAPREHLPLTGFANCRVLRGHSLAAADLWVQGGVIVEPQRLFYGSFQRADVVIDCEGLILAPGYIDLQLNGGFGVDFCSADDGGLAAGVRTVAERVLANGVTAFLPTVITSSADAYRRILPQLAPSAGSASAAAVSAPPRGPVPLAVEAGLPPGGHLATPDGAPDQLRRVVGDLVHNVRLDAGARAAARGRADRRAARPRRRVAVGHSMATAEERRPPSAAARRW